MASARQIFPRQLREKERDLIEFALPAESSGYRAYRELVAGMVVLGEGRRGEGNLVLGRTGDIPDITSPLAPVIAYGMMQTTTDTFTITVREFVGDQIDVEIVSSRGTEVPDHFEEKWRWTYSTWRPGMASPATRSEAREIIVGGQFVLVIARNEKRIWLHDAATLMNHLIPITNFYNELMLHKNVRDPNVALKSNLLFDNLEQYTDDDLCAAFISYNKQKKRVEIVQEPVQKQKSALTGFLEKMFGKKA